MGSVVDGLLGRDEGAVAPLRDFKPVGISAGGFNFNQQRGKNNGAFTGGSTEDRLGLIRDVSGLFSKQAGEIRNLRSLVSPGFSQFRNALGNAQRSRLAQVEDSRSRAIGDLRENLSRRRVLGSSFGQDALTRANVEFSRQRDEVLSDIGLQEAQTTLQELEATRALIGEEFTLARGSVETFINNLNLEASIATQLAAGATSALSANAQMQAKILQEQVNNTQEFLTGLLGVGIGAGAGESAGIGAGAGILAMSDRRLKSNIKRIGTHHLGIGIYEFDIFGKRDIGVMADEVMKVKPDAVVKHRTGYLMVDYGKL